MLTPSTHAKQSKKHDGKQIENEKVKVFLQTDDMILYMQGPWTHNQGTSTAEISSILYTKNRQIECKEKQAKNDFQVPTKIYHLYSLYIFHTFW